MDSECITDYPKLALQLVTANALIQIALWNGRQIGIDKRRSQRGSIDIGPAPGIRVAMATPKEQSNVLCRDDLKSELGSLPTEAIFGSPYGVCFALVKDALVVALLCA